MGEDLDSVRGRLEAGGPSAEMLVVLYRAAEEAEHDHDVERLEEITRLATQATRAAGGALHSEAARLLDLCEERLERTRGFLEAAGSAASGDTLTCPGCGRDVDASAVRCRACGTLLV